MDEIAAATPQMLRGLVRAAAALPYFAKKYRDLALTEDFASPTCRR